MRGSIVYQVQKLFNDSGINRIGTSKHHDKETFRASSLSKVTWHDIGQNTGIYSYSTADDYRDVWINVFKYAKEHFGIKNIELINAEHIEFFLLSKIDDNVAHSTFMKYAAALEKLSVALRLYFKKDYDFNINISGVREIAHNELKRFNDSRAYKEPVKLIKELENELYRLIASIQYYAGARIDEIYGIKPGNIAEFSKRPYTNDNIGIIAVKGKGGKIRDIYLPVKEYKELKNLVENHRFEFRKSAYLNTLKKSSVKTNQKYNGSHGLRWNFAQNRMKELQKIGLIYEQCLTIVSNEMGHERADITEHYLK